MKELNVFTVKKVLFGLGIAFFVAISFGFAVDVLWYREDDLGVIVNGLIQTKKDLVRVFSADERDFVVPVNFKRTKANVISGFLRPVKNVFFTLIHYFFGLNIKAYYWFHVIIHALNAFLFFLLLGFFISDSYAALGALLFAFYPDNSWLVWIAATHNSLCIMFLLFAMLAYRAYFFEKNSIQKNIFLLAGTGICMLISLLSRENAILLPGLMLFGVWLFYYRKEQSFVPAFYTAIGKTWIFFLVNVVYTIIRCWAFGFESLERTVNNLFLRFSFLSKIFPAKLAVLKVAVEKSPVMGLGQQSAETMHTVLETSITQLSYVDVLAKKISTLSDIFFAWSSVVFCIERSSLLDKVIIVGWWVLFVSMCFFAFKQKKELVLFFIGGFFCFGWQAFLAYPAPRYLNTAYPFIILAVVFGLYYLQQQQYSLFKRSIVLGVAFCLGFSLVNGYRNNLHRAAVSGSSMLVFEQRYARFFTENKFPSGTKFFLLGSPFVSDIQTIFQYFLHDYTVVLAHELFATVAEQGVFGCQQAYYSKGVLSTVYPIPGGYRFVSQEPNKMAWWIKFSDHPIKFSLKERSYKWSFEPYKKDVWYDSATGKFKINEQLEGGYVTDISFLIDPVWVDSSTVVVSWDSMQGKYVIIDSSHLLHQNNFGND